MFGLIGAAQQDITKVKEQFPSAPLSVCLFLSQMPGLLPTLKNFSYSMLWVKPHPFLEGVYKKLDILKQADNLHSLSLDERRALAKDLVAILTKKELLDGLTEADGIPAELSQAQKNWLITLATELDPKQQQELFGWESETPATSASSDAFYSMEDDATTPTTSPEQPHISVLIHNVHATIFHLRDLQLGLIPAGIEWLKKTATSEKVKELCGLIPDPHQPDATGMRRKNLELEKALCNRSRSIEAPKEPSTETLDDKIKKLQQLGEQFLMTQLLFRGQKEAFQKVLSATNAVRNCELAADLDIAFQESLAFVFTSENKSWKDTARLWLMQGVAFPLIRLYLHYALSKVRGDLEQFLELSPENKMDAVFRLAVDPLADHLKHITDRNEAVVNKSLPHRLSFYLVDKYVPTFASVHLDTRLEALLKRLEGSLLNRAVPTLKAVLQAVSFIPDTLIYLIDTFVHKELLRQALARVVLPELLNPSWVSHGTRSPYQHALNQVALEQLQQLNAGKQKSATKAVKTSFQKQEKLAGMIVRLSRAISLHDAEVSGKVPSETVENLKTEGSVLASPTVALLILQTLETSLEGDKLSESLIKALDSVTATLQSSLPPPSEESMRQTEHELLQALKRAAGNGVEELAQTLLDPSKKLQEELTFKLQELREAAGAFAKTDDLENGWKKFSLAVTDFATYLKDKQIPSLLALSNELLTAFKQQTDRLNGLITALRPSQLEITRTIQTKDNLSGRLAFFNNAPTLDEILKGLTTLKSLSEQDTEDLFLQQQIRIFTKQAEGYKEARLDPNPSKALLESNPFSIFKAALESSIERFDDTIADKKADLDRQKASIPAEIKKLVQWTQTLSVPTITPEEVASPIQMVIQKLAPILQTPLVNLITAYGTSAYSMASNPYHSHQMIQRVAEAFLKL